ncbi:hypothetical protein AB0H12_30770 [Actinosynnema sp. NPDC023794]
MTDSVVRPGSLPDRDRVLEIFFDCVESDVADDVVFTPIPAFYRALLDGADRVVEHTGWWRLATVERAGRTFCAVQHFEGTRIVDPVRALVTERSRVAFLGLVGAVTPAADIGGLVRITSAGRAPGVVASWEGPDVLDPDVPSVRSLTGDGLLDDPAQVHAVARRISASVVDLETYFFFKELGGLRPLQGIALGLVTDRPGSVPFWDVELDDVDLAAVGARMASTVLGHWLSAH